MGRILKPLIGFYLVLCVALAGAVGTSPILHRWLEHGGKGAAHVHLHEAGEPHQHPAAAHAHPHPHPGVNESTKSISPYEDALVYHGGAFRLPGLQILGRLLPLLLPVRSGSSSEPGQAHEHHSLAQLMAAGLVENFAPPSLTAFLTPGDVALLPLADFSIILPSWNPQACPRGPPTVCI